MSFVGFVRTPDGGRAIVGDRYMGKEGDQECYLCAQPKVFQHGPLLVGSVGSFRVLDELRRLEPTETAVDFALRCRDLFRELAQSGDWVSDKTIALAADADGARPVSYADRSVHPPYKVPGLKEDGWDVICLGPGRMLGYGAGYAMIQSGETDPERIARVMAEAAAGWCTAVRTPFDVLAIPPTAQAA